MARQSLIWGLILAVSTGSSAAADIGGDQESQLERLVIQDCGSCHGLTLKGGLGRDITPEAMAHYDRETLRDIILDGIPGTAMPPWRPLLSEGEALWIADYLLEGARP